MLSQAEQAAMNLAEARVMRAQGHSYRDIRRKLAITANQLQHIRRVLKREKASRTRLSKAHPDATDRDLPVRQSALPIGLREVLVSAGYRTLGDLADRLADPSLPGLETLTGIGPYRARLIAALLDQYELLPGPSDLQTAVEHLFPDLATP